jgi:hypothetical protein
MSESKLSPEQIKSLILFKHYMQSYGKRRMYKNIIFYDGVEDWEEKTWWGDGSLESYEAIDDTIRSIINNHNLDDEMDCEDRCELKIEFDAVDNEITFIAVTYYMSSRESGDEKEISELGNGNEFIEMAKSQGVDVGVVYFNGGGDSGEIDSNMSFQGGSLNLPRGIEDSLYDWLESFYGGWEINEGSQGHFSFDFDEGTVQLFFEENYEESDTDTLFEANF